MADLANLTKAELIEIKEKLIIEYNNYVDKKLSLDMSRGKPDKTQLNLSNRILNNLDSFISEEGIDARNYGVLDGLKEIKDLFSELLDIPASQIIIGGNSSLNLIYDSIARLFMFGSLGEPPWHKHKKIKMICPCPGYDRHFAILNEFGIEMIVVPMTKHGPDMDKVEELVKHDASIRGIVCIPLYSNPTGICYSDEVVERLAKMQTAAKDFKIIWDNAYAVHHLYNEIKLLNIIEVAKKYNTQDRILYFFSTSKVTFAGAGVAIVASGEKNIEDIKKRLAIQTIGYDKLNQLRTAKFFKNAQAVKEHMKKHAEILKPKFDIVLNYLEENFSENHLLKWETPLGGYFISVDTMNGCAKEVVRLAKEAGVILTDAGATYPHKNDPHDSNIRIAPSFAEVEELKTAVQIFGICVKIASVNKLLEQI